MKVMTISSFKTYALKMIDMVAKTREHVVITKRGKPLAEIIPFQNSKVKSKSGKLSKMLVYEKDIVSPLGKNLWEAA